MKYQSGGAFRRALEDRGRVILAAGGGGSLLRKVLIDEERGASGRAPYRVSSGRNI